jgi:hypothetical protein
MRVRIFPDESAFASEDDVATLGERAKRRLWARWTRECEAMAQHALSTGHTVPIEVIELLDHAFSSLATQATLQSPAAAGPVRGEWKADASPLEVPVLVALSRVHAALAVIIAPATPEAILMFSDQRIKHPHITTFGPVPVARQMLGLGVVSLIVLLGVSLSPDVNGINMSKTLLELSGVSLFLVEIFLLSASSLGSCFANLQRINRYVSDGTWNPKYRSTYWTRWVMGVISGIVLSQLVYDVFVASSAPKAGATIPGLIGGPLLALLGGYSVDVVHSILNRIINAVSSVFRGTGDGPSGRQRSPADADRSIQDRLNTATSIATSKPVNALPGASGQPQAMPQ